MTLSDKVIGSEVRLQRLKVSEITIILILFFTEDCRVRKQICNRIQNHSKNSCLLLCIICKPKKKAMVKFLTLPLAEVKISRD